MRGLSRNPGNLVDEIEAATLDPASDLPTSLRKCLALGGVVGSDNLREWAVRELKGYESDQDVPAYREATAPLQLDGMSGNYSVENQSLDWSMIPEVAREALTEEIKFRQPIAELIEAVAAARRGGETVVRLGVPGGGGIVAMINYKVGPAQRVDRVFWAVSTVTMSRVVDVVRTTLVELIAEMRAGMPVGQTLPSPAIANQAVEVAIHGKRHRVIINQVGDGQTAASIGGTSSVGAVAESRAHRVMWWAVGIAGIVAAVAAVWILFL